MTLEELRQSWISESKPEVQARIWDRVAGDYGKKPIPNPETDPFLQHMAEWIPLTKQIKTLDIGCGAGLYSLALAPFVGTAEGIDISRGMIKEAERRSTELGLSNTRFSKLNWNDVDIDAMDMRGAYDVVFAHMTPAVADYAALDRLNACSRNLCMLEKPTRRHDTVLDAALRLVGIPASSDYDAGFLNILTYLWLKGHEPALFYRKEKWEVDKTTEDMTAWCTDRAKFRRELSPDEEDIIRRYVETLSRDGIVKETTVTTRVTVIWKTNKE